MARKYVGKTAQAKPNPEVLYYSDRPAGVLHATRSLHNMGIRWGDHYSFFASLTDGTLSNVSPGKPQLVIVNLSTVTRINELLPKFHSRNAEAIVVVLDNKNIFGKPLIAETPGSSEEGWLKVKQDGEIHLIAQAFLSGKKTTHVLRAFQTT